MKKLITIILITLSVSVFGQVTKEVIDGKEYIIHTVKEKETLYRISKNYNVSKKEIRIANPELGWFTKEGQILKIPTGFTDENIHVIEKGETLYGISRKYGVSIEELTKLNPKNALNLKVGEKLILPKDKKFKEKEIVETAKKVVLDTVIHTVKKGETLYGIARMYSTTVAKITALNPTKVVSLGIGDKLKLPQDIVIPKLVEEVKTEVPVIKKEVKEITKKEIEEQVEVEKIEADKKEVVAPKTINHKVVKGETLYNISKKYGTTVTEIQKLNPEVKELKIGSNLIIPVSEEFSLQKVSLGDPIKISKEDFKKIHKVNPLKDGLEEMITKESYNMTLLLPFMLDKNATFESKPVNVGKVYSYTEMATHFYQGVQIALDSVKTAGISINLHVYDTKKDTNTISKLLKTSELQNSDLILGPFFEKPYKMVSTFAKENKVQTVCPVNQSNIILFNNPYVTELKSSLPTQINKLASYIGENYNTQNVICVSGKSKKDKYLATLFSKNYATKIEGKTNNYRAEAKTYKMTSFSDMKKFDANLVKGKKNILVIPFTEIGMATSFFTQLNMQMARKKMRGFDVEIFALENFIEYDDINIEFKLKYNLHVTSSSFIDYKSERVIEFVKKYREEFGTEPSRYAFMGFDAMFYHALTMHNYGKNFTSFYGSLQLPLLQTPLDLQKTDENSGFENQNVVILKYVDYELVEVE